MCVMIVYDTGLHSDRQENPHGRQRELSGDDENTND